MAQVQVPPGELRGRCRSADTDVDVGPLFGVSSVSSNEKLLTSRREILVVK
jgi:hypothetical protein